MEIKDGRYKKHRLKNVKEFQENLPLRLNDVYKKGKVLFLFFEHGWTIIVKFGMTGWFYFDNEQGDIIFIFENGKQIVYQDPRHFGTFTITQNGDEVMKEINKISPDILDPLVSYIDIKDNINSLKPNLTLDTVLIDQGLLLSGIGNIIKSEIMYDARIDPKRKIKDIDDKEWKKIFSSAKRITNKVYEEIENNSENEFIKIQKIYQQQNDPKGNKVMKFQSSDGRVTFWVPSIQK